MNVDWPLILWRIVPTVLFLGGALPLYVRAIRGVIPADPPEGVPRNIVRDESPGVFWRWMTPLLFIAIALTAWFVIAWFIPPPRAG